MLRNRQLHDALREFALDAAALLDADQEAGAELPFDLDHEPAPGRPRGPALYRYRPLTERFIGERWERLRALPSCGPAALALGAGAERWLRLSGLRGAEAEPALQAMLERLYEDATGFAFPEERFERLYHEVEQLLYVESRASRIVVPLPGLDMELERVELEPGLALVRGEKGDFPAEAVWAVEEEGGPRALCVLERELAPDDPLPVAEARDRFRRLVSGLRLFKPGGVTVGAVAWTARADDRWQPLELEYAGAARGEPWILVAGEEVELCAFLDTLEHSSADAGVAWALSRFEMGCSRRLESEALSDYLLALRALLGDEGGGTRPGLALRLAALCAEDGERKTVQRRVELALALERFVMGGGREDGYLEAVGSESPRLLVAEMERHARGLLRDVICGYLEPDLAAVADDILLATAVEPSVAEQPPMDDRPPVTAARVAPQTASVLRAAAEEPLPAEDDPFPPDEEPFPAEDDFDGLGGEEEILVHRTAAAEPQFEDDAGDWSAPV